MIKVNCRDCKHYAFGPSEINEKESRSYCKVVPEVLTILTRKQVKTKGGCNQFEQAEAKNRSVYRPWATRMPVYKQVAVQKQLMKEILPQLKEDYPEFAVMDDAIGLSPYIDIAANMTQSGTGDKVFNIGE